MSGPRDRPHPTRRQVLAATGAGAAALGGLAGCLEVGEDGEEGAFLAAVAGGPDAGYLFAGQSRGDPFAARYGPDGARRWRTRLDAAPGTVADAVAVGGGHVVLGHRDRADAGGTGEGTRAGDPVAWAARLDTDGTVRWSRRYPVREGAGSRIRAGTRDGDGVAFVGPVSHPSFGTDDPLDPGRRPWLVRVGPDGRVRADGPLGADAVGTVARAADGGLLVGGRSGGGAPDAGLWPGAWLAKVPTPPGAVAEPAWTLDATASEVGALAAAPGGGAVAAAPTAGPFDESSAGDEDPVPGVVFGVGPSGDVAWRTRFPSDAVVTPRGALADGDGVLVVGDVAEWRDGGDGGETGPTRGFAARYGPDGARRWRVRYGDRRGLVLDAAPARDGWVVAGTRAGGDGPVPWAGRIGPRGRLDRAWIDGTVSPTGSR